MMDIFTEANAPFPCKVVVTILTTNCLLHFPTSCWQVTWFEAKSAKSATGLVQFESVEEACEAVVICNNSEIQVEGGAR